TICSSVVRLVAHGLGVTLVPEMAMRPAGTIPDLKIVPFQEPMPLRMICLAWRRNKARHDECVELAKIIRGLGEAVLAN
ncbi:hydrogen peroxide-inducible genes activator, partial [Mesorhizobium sp. M4A.F.Ca.ET.050.02.1.1]|uniref:LysR substrate-binding domain-containing protein n=1 Tax=Mesorhizobium sp. M4A.F.Ca.ET.050.02.1.1 TaxID=2496754 RepID=UPI000FD288C4